MKKKLNEKTIAIEIINGKLTDYTFTVGVDDVWHDVGLKEIALTIELLRKKQEKIMNKQKDEANKLKVGIGKCTPYNAIVLPDDAPLSLVIQLLNDMHLDITRDDRKNFWKPYIVEIRTMQID